MAESFIPQSVTHRVPIQAFLSSDHVSPATGKTIAITISKNGAAYANPSGGATNATEIASGSYYVDLSTTDTGTTGPLFVLGTSAATDNVNIFYSVVNAHNAGFDGVPNAVAGASTGLLISGTNSGTTTLGALTVTGATIHTGNVSMAAGLTITQSTSNGSGLDITGNGSGAGIKVTAGASGSGITITTTSGDGISITPTAGNGITCTANGTSKHGMVITGGTAGTSDGLKCAAGTGGVDIRGAITGNLTGNVSGSIGSVTSRVTANTDQWAGGTIPSPNVTGVPLVDDKYLLGTIYSTPATAGIMDVNTKNINNVAAATPGASGGVLISGSNSGTTTLGALTVTGATIHTGNVSMAAGLTITQSTSNGSGINVTGNGTGAGISTTGGATGHGLLGSGGATSGDGVRATGGTNGHGMTLIGTSSSRHGLNSLANGSSGSGASFVGIGGGDGITANGANNGHGINVASGSGTGSGIKAVSAGSGDGIIAVGGSGGVDIRGAITGNITGNLSGSVGSVTGLTASNLDATVSSRMATYTQPTGFLTATFPSGTVANTTNITAGTITTATNLTNAATSGDFTSTMKTSLNAATPASVVGSVGSVTARVTANADQIAGNATAATNMAAVESSLETGTLTAGGTNTATLRSGASSVNDYYANQVLFLMTNTGSGQTNRVLSYNGTTKVCTLESNWGTVPDSSTTYLLIGRIG